MTNVLFHNEGGGKFGDERSSESPVKGKALGVAFNDYDGDGFADIFVANDGMEQSLFPTRATARSKSSAGCGVAYSDDGAPCRDGRGVADYDNDGLPDIVVTNLALEKYALYRNEGGGQFRYASLTTGLAALTAHSSVWGTGLFDFDNDGWKDLFVAQGHVLDNVEKIHSGLRYLEPPVLFRNAAGKFEKTDASGWPAVAGRGAAFGDLNNDGYVDAVVSVLGGVRWSCSIPGNESLADTEADGCPKQSGWSRRQGAGWETEGLCDHLRQLSFGERWARVLWLKIG